MTLLYSILYWVIENIYYNVYIFIHVNMYHINTYMHINYIFIIIKIKVCYQTKYTHSETRDFS